MRKTNIGILLLVILLSSCGVAHTLKKAEEYLAVGEYYDAGNQYKKAFRMIPAKERSKRGEIALKQARCYAKINQSVRAAAAYANAVRYGKADKNDMLNYARQLLKQGKYKDAEKIFVALQDSMPNDTLVRNGLISAQNAAKWKKEGSRYSVKRMNIFNSHRADYSPMLFGDNSDQLYFTSTRNEASGNELSGITGTKTGDIFVAMKNERGQWQRPEVVNGGLNSDFDEGACCFSPDQHTMYLTQCTTDPQYPRLAKILTSSRSDAAWAKPTELAILKDTLSCFAHPAVSPDGKWLYFVSDMPGGFGGLDIWRAMLTSNGIAGIENMGAEVNTPGNETFPTVRPNGDLYFSSDGHAGMGGLDIFIYKKGNDGKMHVEHPGYPLNSMADDFGMTFDGVYNRGFFSSNRNDARGYDHIYSFENPEIVQTIKGWVYEMDGYELPAAQVYIVGNDGTNQHLSVKSDGSFTYKVEPDVSYIMLATCKGHLNHKEELTTTKVTDSKEHVLQFPLASISAPVLIDNIFYDLNKATLRQESTQALDQLVTLLNENPHVTIELAAHCDYRGNAAYNQQLSQKRAEAVVSYLIAKGIDKQRLTPVGYGKQKPKTINKKVAEKYPWLKVGDVLTEDFIQKQDASNQDICNQLNRRTEFQVLRTTWNMF